MKLSSYFNVIALLCQEREGITPAEIARRVGETEENVLKLLGLLNSSIFHLPLITREEQDESAEFARLEQLEAAELAGIDAHYEDFKRRCHYSIMPDGRQKYPQLHFTLEELIALHTVLSQAQQDPGKKRQGERLWSQLQGNLSGSLPRRRIKGTGYLKQEEVVLYKKAVLERALLEEHVLKLAYPFQKTGTLARFLFYPLGLILDRNTGFWYLLGSHKLTPKKMHPQFLRVDRIEEVQALKQRFSYPSTFNLHRFMKPYWGVQPGKPVPVKVRFWDEAQVIRKAVRELQHRCPPAVLQREKNGSLLFCGEVVGVDAFRAWLRQFGASAEVLEPPELRSAMVKTARELCRLHRS